LKLQITIDGKAYEVEVEVLEDEGEPAPNQSQRHAPHATSSYAQSMWDDAGKICRSPVMGLAIKVNVKPGQMVKAAELVLVLEAMKMETHVTAPCAGKLKNVYVAAGDSVKLNQVLLEFE